MADKNVVSFDEDEIFFVWNGMCVYGGHFAKALGKALVQADLENAQKIKDTWPELWAKYESVGRTMRKEGRI